MKDRKENRTFELQETCNFPEVFRHCSIAPDSLSTSEMPDAQIGHIRAYHDGYQWQGQYFPCRNGLRTKAFDRESQDIYRCLVTQLDTMEALRGFCRKYPSAKVGEHEYSFFMNGHAADYWIRFISVVSEINNTNWKSGKKYGNIQKRSDPAEATHEERKISSLKKGARVP